MRVRRLGVLTGVAGVVLAAGVGAAAAGDGTTTPASVSDTGVPGGGTHPSISGDGRYVAFVSAAGVLVPGDTNGKRDVFVRDRVGGTTTRASVSSSGAQSTRNSDRPAISADGRFVAFVSLSSELVPGDTNDQVDIFVRDLRAGTTSRLEVSDLDPQAGGVDPLTGLSISADGRYVAFVSAAADLVPGDTNGRPDVFVRDRTAGTTQRVSVSGSGQQGNAQSPSSFTPPSISPDGRYVVFDSLASNLVPGDTNNRSDVFVRDRTAGTTRRVSVSSSGRQGNADSRNGSGTSISADGRFVVFRSKASNLVAGDTNRREDVFLRDLTARTTTRVDVTDAGRQTTATVNEGAAISADGRYIVFDSDSPHLVAGDTNDASDVFVRDRRARTTALVSRTSTGSPGDGSSGGGVISADGRYVAFTSLARLVPSDTNSTADVYVRDRGPSR